ncbi:rhodanese-like domain-containing protein [Thiomicrorhabdus heinhorstiae]|uniref:Sulfurtransferase n=1 Tax=Thiomicrorhabdus heinhorstiae TaxID=2748010 RepID=A0ABS0BUB7_9GAMM|nr:rhodanese-like domain-containing protein [Thiomicrorhabdus heinhorstiae]MBF6057432.1 sulfurtransferase [Thiomicrorhabdus heinhorstiae]
MLRRQFIVAAIAGAFVTTAFAGPIEDKLKLPEKKFTEVHHYLSPQQTYDAKMKDPKNVLLVDIRTPYELQFVGYAPLIDGNVPYITYDYSDWDDKKKEYKRMFNSGFVGQVEDLMKKTGIDHGKNTKIIFMCRSGDRSARATDIMSKNGYSNVWSAYQGFEGDKAKSGATKGQRTVNGWKNAGLPWTYKLDKNKAAFIF